VETPPGLEASAGWRVRAWPDRDAPLPLGEEPKADKVMSPVLVPERLEKEPAPSQVKAPDVVIVQPVEPLPPANRIEPVEVAPMETVPEPLASRVRFSLVPEDRALMATPPVAAADLIFTPVAEEAVEASIWRAGLVVPLAPTAKALALEEVTVRVPEVETLPDVSTLNWAEEPTPKSAPGLVLPMAT